MKSEIWKDIPGYEGYYQISNFGRVKSLTRRFTRSDGKEVTFKERLLKPGINQTGYKYVNLSKGGRAYCARVHRLVAQSFVPNPKRFPCINHKDENKLNNNSDNLEWCSFQYNLTYNNKQMCRATPVLQFTKNGEFVKAHVSQAEAERSMGCGRLNISACCSGRIKSCAGYVWKYAV